MLNGNVFSIPITKVRYDSGRVHLEASQFGPVPQGETYVIQAIDENDNLLASIDQHLVLPTVCASDTIILNLELDYSSIRTGPKRRGTK